MLVITVGIFFLLMLLMIAIILIDMNRFVIRKYTITSNQIKEDYKFVMLSDLHNKSYGKDNQKLIDAIYKINPKSVVVAGDMITGTKGEEVHNAVALLKGVSKKYPVIYANGNHEYRMRIYPEIYGMAYDNYMNQLRDCGIIPLINQSCYLPETNIVFHGCEIDRKYFRKLTKISMEEDYIKELLGSIDKERFHILIAHHPDYFDAYAKWGADLVLSGHIHGGIIRLPFLGGVVSPSVKLFPYFDGGLYKKEHSTMILSRGLGTHTLPVRLMNPGELIVIELKKEK